MPSTFFTEPPHFRWLIILYFFIGGISGGALLLASLLRLFGTVEERPLVRLASYLSLAGAVLSGILLIVDLGVPVRFWHMLLQNHTWLPLLKWWSPMSVGVWGLLFFGLFALLASLGAAYEDGALRWRALGYLAEDPLAIVGAIGGIIGGLFLAGYTGVLLAATNRPVWADSAWLGILFLFSAGSTSAAALLLLAWWRGVERPGALAWLGRFDDWILLLELITLVIFVIAIGPAARVFLSAWGVLLVIGVLLIGILLPLAIGWGYLGGRRTDGAPARVWSFPAPVTAATLVLIGGFLLRVVVLLSSEQVRVVGTEVFRP